MTRSQTFNDGVQCCILPACTCSSLSAGHTETVVFVSQIESKILWTPVMQCLLCHPRDTLPELFRLLLVTFSGNTLSSESNRTVNNRLKLQPLNVSSVNPIGVTKIKPPCILATTPVTEVYHLHGLQLQRRTLDTVDHHHHHHTISTQITGSNRVYLIQVKMRILIPSRRLFLRNKVDIASIF